MARFRIWGEVGATAFAMRSVVRRGFAPGFLATWPLGASGCESRTDPRIEPVPPDSAFTPEPTAPPEA